MKNYTRRPNVTVYENVKLPTTVHKTRSGCQLMGWNCNVYQHLQPHTTHSCTFMFLYNGLMITHIQG